ncbi:unnamed protein product [Brachionus calyciflorus]|uniref:BHLH domain-containing protein n=1 Tax=Brachionus calyciflorus TaxID=104777 RepID=A0A813UBB5_9BILA|nr:unnamed protein product [Brachionus calyciflorus]
MNKLNIYKQSSCSNEIVENCENDQDDYQNKPKKLRTNNIESNFKEPNQANERTRLVSINEAFEILRLNIPTFPYERRLSKIDTLHLAISYINLLESILESNMNLFDYFQSVLLNTLNGNGALRPIWATSDLTVRLNWLNWNNLGIRNDKVQNFLNLFQFFNDCKKERNY